MCYFVKTRAREPLLAIVRRDWSFDVRVAAAQTLLTLGDIHPGSIYDHPELQESLKNVRKHLKVRPGQSVRWQVVKEMVVVDVHKKMTNPVKFLTSQVKLDLDLVKLVKETREEFS